MLQLQGHMIDFSNLNFKNKLIQKKGVQPLKLQCSEQIAQKIVEIEQLKCLSGIQSSTWLSSILYKNGKT